MDDGSSALATRRISRRTARQGCSCDELIRIAEEEVVSRVLADFAMDRSGLMAGRSSVHASEIDEPADWHVRLHQRGAPDRKTGCDDPLAVLLAIVRSADCHAYRLLEQSGVSCGRLRRVLVRRLRSERAQSAHAERTDPEAKPSVRRAAGTDPLETSSRGGSVRQARGQPDLAPHTNASGPARLIGARRSEATTDSCSAEPRLGFARRRPGATSAIDGLTRSTDPHHGASRRTAAVPTTPPSAGTVANARPDVGARSGRARARASRTLTDLDRPSHSAVADLLRAGRAREPRPSRSVTASKQRADRVGSTRPDAIRPGTDAAGSETNRVETKADTSTCAAEPNAVPALLQPIVAGELTPLFGREADVARLADAASRLSRRPVLLVGPPGSGRSLLANHLGRVVPGPVERLDATRCEDEDVLRSELAAADRRNATVILDDIDRVPGEGAPAWLGALGHAWANAAPRIVTIVSSQGRARLESWLPNASDAFDIIELNELDDAAAEQAVSSCGATLVRARGLRLDDTAELAELARDAKRWLSGLAMPARALDLLDLACSRTLRRGEGKLRSTHWREIIAERMGLSPERIAGGAEAEALAFEARLSDRVVGHERAITTLAALLRRGRAGFRGQRPLLNALLVGQSGVGKTELAKALADVLYERSDALVRLDMSEYAEAHAVARIVGAPPGYVGHEKGGVLTDALTRNPHCVVLLDEIEKAHRDVHQLLLQILDEGWLTDGRGRRIDFSPCVLVMTSNLGATQLADDPNLGDDPLLRIVAKSFPPELWNRIEAPLVLRSLTDAQLGAICERLANRSSARLFEERGVAYRLATSAVDRLVQLARTHTGQGARPLRHLLARHVESSVAAMVLEGAVTRGDALVVDADEVGGFRCRKSSSAAVRTRPCAVAS